MFFIYTDEGNWDLVGNNTPVFFPLCQTSCRLPNLPFSRRDDHETEIFRSIH
ncbi:catalase [Rhodoferax sp.]|uniref:catalase n=1 Tax=Rhodoferax sp. TaxID=50421 RepID=UPI00341A9F6D